MKGLVYKDLLNFKKLGATYIIFFIIYAVVSFMAKNLSLFGGAICIFAAMLPIQAMSFDEKANWDKYALTMPISEGI